MDGPLKSVSKLTEAQEERLIHTAEEASEVSKSTLKILRHGYDSHNPKTRVRNDDHLREELTQLVMSIERLKQHDGFIFDWDEAVKYAPTLWKEKRHWFHHQPD